MMRFANVRQILYVSFFLSATPGGASVLPLTCGHYLGNGQIELNSQGQVLLALQKGSSSPLELILLGGDLDQRREYLGTEATVDFYVPRKIVGNHEPFVFLKSFTKTERKFPPDGLLKTRKDVCALKKYAP